MSYKRIETKLAFLGGYTADLTQQAAQAQKASDSIRFELESAVLHGRPFDAAAAEAELLAIASRMTTHVQGELEELSALWSLTGDDEPASRPRKQTQPAKVASKGPLRAGPTPQEVV